MDIKGRTRLQKWDLQSEKITCPGCKTPMNSSYFWPTKSIFGHLFTDIRGHRCFPLCKDCTKEVYKKLLEQFNKNIEMAMMRLCMFMDVYWDPQLLKMIQSRKKGVVELPDDYLDQAIGTWGTPPLDNYRGKEFFQQVVDNFDPEQASLVGGNDNYELTAADKENRQAIVQVFLHDPFEKEPPRVRAELYRSLSIMIDTAMQNDFVRQQAAITVVRSFYQIRLIEDQISRLMIDPVNNGEAIEQLNKMKAEQNRTVSTFCKDNGFSEKYAANKTKGTGTLSGQMRAMEEMGYDADKVNLYDIKTSKSIEQVAEISAKAISNQLALGDSDYISMLEEQKAVITKLTKENAQLKEKNRLLKGTQVHQELLLTLRRQYVEKGMSCVEIDEALAKEYQTAPGGYPTAAEGENQEQ